MAITADAFALWISPSDALKRLPADWPIDHQQAALLRRLANGLIRACAADAVIFERGRSCHSRYREIEPTRWQQPNRMHDQHFWTVGDVTFDNRPSPRIQYDLSGENTDWAERAWSASFTNVRFDPVGLPLQFGFDPSCAAPAPAPAVTEAENEDNAQKPAKGGRPAGHHGEPIALVTLSLSKLPETKLRAYTAEALGVDLLEKYRALHLAPPSEDNAKRIAAGILRAVRNP